MRTGCTCSYAPGLKLRDFRNPGCVAPLESFMAEIRQGFLGGLFEAIGIFLGFDFCPHSIIPVT